MTNYNETPVLLSGESASTEDDCACPDHDSFVMFESNQVEYTNDCACPERSSFSVPRHPDEAEALFVLVPDCHVSRLTQSHYLILSPYSPNGPCVVNEPGYEHWRAFARPQFLGHQPIDRDLMRHLLIQPIGWKGSWQQDAPSKLTVWLHITNACNLDCPYCYVRKSSASMNFEIGKQALQSVFSAASQNGFKSVKLKFAGGEASLHFDLIRQMHDYATLLSEQHHVDVEEVVLSNGTRICHDDAIWLRDSSIRLAISVDGIGADHDLLRSFRNGKGSFDYIEHTIDSVLLPQGVRPSITITITQANAENVHKVVRWALSRDLAVNLNFYRADIQSRSRTELLLEESTIIRGMEAAYDVFEEFLPSRPFLNGLLDRVQSHSHRHTCGVGTSYVVIDHQGKVAQCQMYLDDALGSVAEPNMLKIISKGFIQNLSVDEKEGCRDCTYRYRCTGGCSLETFRSTGRWDISSPHCQIYRTLYPKAMRLEGLRLLKVHGINRQMAHGVAGH